MEYSFTVKHIKGSSKKAADSLSRLPVVSPGTGSAPFLTVHDASGMSLLVSITDSPPVNNKNVVISDVLSDVKH